jgi:UDP:flavonoid glycosyltransferase YjiC (YdhE family)
MLKERMANLEGEAKELKNFLTTDSQRRAIEHILNEREQHAAKKAMAEVNILFINQIS